MTLRAGGLTWSQVTFNGNWIFMPGQDGYADTAGKALAYDPDLAKKTLTDDGWANADGKWTKGGDTLKLSIMVPQGTASNQLRAQQIQASLKEIDIAVTIDEVPGRNQRRDCDLRSHGSDLRLPEHHDCR